MSNNSGWSLFRIMFHEAKPNRVIPQKLGDEIVGLCQEFEHDVLMLDHRGGYGVNAAPPVNHLFGGTKASMPVFIEVILKNDSLEAFKIEIKKRLEVRKLNAAFYVIPVDAYIFDPERAG